MPNNDYTTCNYYNVIQRKYFSTFSSNLDGNFDGPSSIPGGSKNHYEINMVHYISLSFRNV